jgi:acyl-CoA synthetase (AMP-forming)/AMP-acid ligase II
MILSQQLLMNAAKNLTRGAVRYLGKDILYKDLLASISRLSYLHQRELGQGESIRLAFYSRNCPAMVTTFFAMTNIRAVCIPMDPEAPPEEIVKWLKESKATHVAVSSDLLSKARDILQSAHLNLPIVEMEKKKGGEYDTSFTPPPDHTPKEDDVILMLRSGGTTGKPRFVNFTHRQLLHGAVAIRSHYRLLGTDRIHTTLSWSHPFALVHSLLFPLLSGATCVIDHGLQAADLLAFLVENRVTRLVGTPTYFLKLLVICKNEKKVMPGVKSITVGMGTLSAELKKAFELLKIPVSHCYGMVENLWTIAMENTKEEETSQEAAPYVRGFVGKGLPGLKYKVLDDSGDQIEGKEKRTGQLAVSGPTIMSAYYEREKDTKMALRGTWLYTGDVVQLDGDGDTLTFTLIGRKDDLMKVGDEYVSFQQIDAVLKRHPAIQDGASFAIKNSKDKPVIVCAIVRKPGATLNEKQIVEYCISKLPDHLVPHAVTFTDLIPRDIGNNVNCSRLRGQFSGIAG